ncbi:dihydroorotase [Amorphus orientalis]|uniref:Dihydroorotase n=1 Tax=Amorphus orientalis TaxID=649198 RepID=A0AAE3VLG7_9HYPH|nr:dihydroorotase [Amorphus orientalis]MDQ0314344.1 dihydroorotase [Amorphus orientalis]
MTGTFDTLFQGGTVVTPNGREQADVGVRDGRIAAIGSLGQATAGETVDCRGLHILPGVIDSQVHFREPGLEHKEDLETGARAAVLGGVTGVFEMPNTSPTTTSPAALDDKLRRAKGRMSCEYAFWVGATAENVETLADMEKLPGSAGVKIFMGSSTGTLLVEDDATLDRVMRAISRRCAVHAEDEPRLRERKDLRVPGDPTSHPVWRDPEAALKATRRLVGAARKAGRRVHVLHISTGEEMDFLESQKDVATVEVTPNHLTLAVDEDTDLGTLMQMNPPVRDAAHRERIWRAIRDGVVDVLGSDHAPHTREEKAKPYPESPSGMPGVQTLVPVMLDHVAKGRLSLERFVDLTSAGPQRIFGIANKGRIALGYDADFTVVDLNRTETITNDWIATKAGWTPYHGRSVTGWPVGTIVRGIKVMWEGELVNPGEGAPITFLEALPSGA